MHYIAHSESDIRSMLKSIGIEKNEDLFGDIPQSLRAKKFDLPRGMSEFEVTKYFRALSEKHKNFLNFIGGGYYDHVIPAAVDTLSERGEFSTAYTPYQPEASQGTLQSIFEYQTMICELTGMDAANASLYDGATALAEAVLMAIRLSKKRNTVIVDRSINPLHIRVLKTYLGFQNIKLKVADLAHDNIPFDEAAAVCVQTPDFFGNVHDWQDLVNRAHNAGALMIESVYPLSLGIIASPGEKGMDIAVAEGQSLGLPLAFGGPYLGIIAVKSKFVRQMPGRIVGETVDKEGRRAFVLTLQAREQHIRREKAPSNICSNQGLMALRASIYLSLLGKNGLEKLSRLLFSIAETAKIRLAAIRGVKIVNNETTFNEFTLRFPIPAIKIFELLQKKDIHAGLPVSIFYPERPNDLIVAFTEKISENDIENFAKAIEAVL